MLDLLMVAQGEHKRLGITLTVPQQEQPEEEGKGGFLRALARKSATSFLRWDAPGRSHPSTWPCWMIILWASSLMMRP